MSTPLPTTEIYAFAVPVAAGDELRVAVRLADGLHVLQAQRSVWRDLHKKLQTFFAPGPAAAPAPRRAQRPAIRGRSPRPLDPLREAACLAAALDWARGKYGKQREAASAHGIGYWALVNWLSIHRAEVAQAAGAAGREPIAKPNGRML